jgi:hypothetical protein
MKYCNSESATHCKDERIIPSRRTSFRSERPLGRQSRQPIFAYVSSPPNVHARNRSSFDHLPGLIRGRHSKDALSFPISPSIWLARTTLQPPLSAGRLNAEKAQGPIHSVRAVAAIAAKAMSEIALLSPDGTVVSALQRICATESKPVVAGSLLSSRYHPVTPNREFP